MFDILSSYTWKAILIDLFTKQRYFKTYLMLQNIYYF